MQKPLHSTALVCKAVLLAKAADNASKSVHAGAGAPVRQSTRLQQKASMLAESAAAAGE